ncbi:MAG TPA: winged helix-turn-helix domain-containing protein, partial [Alphaproteobacteria bacterium]|nr:winged helix-turn-helix domain-containing protein [Alphaproteobacteria bacterium]
DIWRFDVDTAVLLVDGRAIHLTVREAAIAGLLLKHIGKPIHRDRLIIAMYGDDEPGGPDKALEVHVCHIRRKLRDTRLRIVPQYGFGYAITIGPKEQRWTTPGCSNSWWRTKASG